MRRLVAIAPVAVLAALCLVFGLYAVHHNPTVIPRATVGKFAPADALPTLAGGPPVAIRSQIRGPTLVNFFASWCVPCAEETPTLAALKAEGVRIVGVAWEDDPAKASGFLARYGDPYQTVLVDRSGRAGIDFGVTGVPETYLVNAEGRIVDKRAAPLSPADADALLKRVAP
ncbi:MAG: DsbE family thiol:disulfide interchange protein [Caulobacteraceae bacterium]